MIAIEINAKVLVIYILATLYVINGIIGYMAINDRADCWKYGIIACIQAICIFVANLLIMARWAI